MATAREMDDVLKHIQTEYPHYRGAKGATSVNPVQMRVRLGPEQQDLTTFCHDLYTRFGVIVSKDTKDGHFQFIITKAQIPPYYKPGEDESRSVRQRRRASSSGSSESEPETRGDTAERRRHKSSKQRGCTSGGLVLLGATVLFVLFLVYLTQVVQRVAPIAQS